MSSADAPFRIVIYSAAGVALGESSAATQLQNNSSLDKLGSCSITIPAADPSVRLFTPGVYIDCFDEVDGYVGRFYYKNRNIKDSTSGAMMQLTCDDNLVALQREFVGYRRKYNFDPVDSVITDLLAVAGWTGIVDTGIGNTTVDYEGESVWAAIDVLRDRWYQHFRLGDGANELEFGAFGDDSGVLLQNLEGQVQSLFEANLNVAHVSSIVESIATDTLYNRIIPTGGGQGSEAELTIQNATMGTYAIHSGLNQDGTSYYYIQDDASIALYGVRTKVVKFPSIRPIANNATDIQRAIEMTKIAAEAYLRQHKDPIYSYALDVIGLRNNVKVGDQVHLDYRSLPADVGGYLDVDDLFYLMDIRYSRDVNGKRVATLTVCTTAQRRTSDTDVMVDVIHDINVLKLHVQPTAFWKESDSQDYCGLDYSTLARRDARFICEIDNSVTKVTKVRIRFKARPLFMTSFEVAPAVTNGSPGDWAVVWGMVEGDQYPKDVRLYIDGVDVTVKYGGPWNVRTSGTPGFAWNIGQYENNPLDVTLDITDDIVNSLSGFYTDHEIRFQAGGERQAFTYSVPGQGSGTTLLGDATSGVIQCNIRIQGITQGINPI